MRVIQRGQDEVNTVRQFLPPYDSVQNIPNRLRKKFDYRLKLIDEQESLTRDELLTIEIDYSNMQRWYEAIKEHTAPSRFIHLSLSELKQIREKQKICATRGWLTRDYEDFTYLIARLQPFFQLTNETDTVHYFFKMSSNSPKDIRDNPCYDETVMFHRSKCKSTGQYRKMCVHSPHEVIYSMCMSERLYATMRDRPLGHYIVLRDWINANPEYEFRCFIYNENLTAISQYHSATGYIFDSKTILKIGKLILNFWERIKNPLIEQTTADWVMDVVILSIENNEVKIIELNGFGAHMITGAAQYCWKLDYDLIHRTDGKCTIRHLIKTTSDENGDVTYTIEENCL